MTSLPVRDELGDHLLTPQNSALILQIVIAERLSKE